LFNFLVYLSIFINSYHASKRVTKSFSCYQELSDKHKDYLPEFKDNCNAIIKCIDQNNEIIRLLIKDVNDIFQNKSKVLWLLNLFKVFIFFFM
jgi:hypothetical protein